MSTITREMLNIPSDMLKERGPTIAQLRNELKQQKEKERQTQDVIAHQNTTPQKDNETAKNSGEQSRRNGLFEVGFPPRIFPWESGYEEYMKLCHERTVRRNKPILRDHPDYKLEEPYSISIDVDTKVTDGFIEQLDEHMKVWTEPCLIHLSDLLKQTKPYQNSFAEFKRYEKSAFPERVACRRHYALPHSHREDPMCDCIFCRSCRETVGFLQTVGLTPEYLAMSMIDKIRQRTASVLISQVKMAFQEEADIGLDERICYGFRSALPPLVILHFEHVFHEMYTIGADLCWEILKKLAVVIKYTPDYTSALHFLTFWVDSCERLDRVIRRLENDMDCFNWKLKEYNLNLKIFFFNFVSTLINDLDEFQDVLRHCKRLVALQRVYHPCRENEIDNRYLLLGLARAESNLVEAREGWKDHCLPFEVREYVVPKFNVFKISRLRNPFLNLPSNTVEGYEVMECSVSGTLDIRKVDKEVIEECDFAEPILDVCISNPKHPKLRFHIRLYRREHCLAPVETNQFVKHSDVNFLRHHGANITLQYGGRDYMDNYLQKREINNLDKVEGRLPMEIEDILYADSRQAARDEVRLKKRILNAKEKERSTRSSAPLKWPPTYPIYGHKTRHRSMLRSFKTILQRTFWKPRVLKYCRKGIKCERYERSFTSRYRYAFGGLPVINRDPRSALMEGQKYDFAQEIISSAMQLGTGLIDPLEEDGEKSYKYYVLYSQLDSSLPSPQIVNPRRNRTSTEHTPELFATLCQAINIHYNSLAKFELITIEESLSSPHLLQKEWASTVQNGGEVYDIRNLNSRITSLKMTGRVQVKAQGSPANVPDEGGYKYFNNPSESRRRKVVAAATQNHIDGEEDLDHLVAISEDGEIVAFGARLSPPPQPPEPRARNCRHKEKPQNNWKNMPACRCPHGHGDSMSHSVTFDGTLHVEATLDMGTSMCSHHHHETGHNHQTPPPLTRSQPSTGASQKSASKTEQRPSRPGLPVSVGYAEKRNDLRQKLERGKQELKACQHERAFPISPWPNLVSSVKKAKKETVVFTTTSPATDDLDELVNIIEGTPMTGPNGSRKGSLSNDPVDPKKAAKKARKKERKEQLRLEEEAQRLAEEELQKRLEEERLLKEENEREELAKKKREKKKQKKKNKKMKGPLCLDLLTKELREELIAAGRQDEIKELEKQEQEMTKEWLKKEEEWEREEEERRKELEKKKKEENRNTASSKVSTNSETRTTPAGRNLKLVEENKTLGSAKADDNPIVTIRRHSNTPDANVTISVKGDNGEEDVLYTLVNGKVLRAELQTKGTSTTPSTSEVSKKKKKKSKDANSVSSAQAGVPEGISHSKGKENGVIMVESIKTYDDERRNSNSSMNITNSYGKQTSNITERTPVNEDRGSHCQNIDVNNLNLPSGLIITRLDQPHSLYTHSTTNVTEPRSWESRNINRVVNPAQVYSSVSQATDSYDQNVFVGSSNYSQGEDCQSFGQQPVFPGKEPGTGEFEEVVSNKKRRLRNKANKLKDGDEEPELYPQHRDSSGSLEFKMMDLSLNSSGSAHCQTSYSKRIPDDVMAGQINSLAETGRRKRISQKSQGKATQDSAQRKVNGQPSKGSSHKSSYQTRESTPSIEFTPSPDSLSGRGGKVSRGGGAIPRLNKQTPTRPLFATTQEDSTQRSTMISWTEPTTTVCEQPTPHNASVRRLHEMGYVQSHSQPGHFEKNEQVSQMNGGWHPLNSYSNDCRQEVSFHPIDTASQIYHNNMAAHTVFNPNDHNQINYQGMHQQSMQQSFQFMGSNSFHPNLSHNPAFNFEPSQPSFSDYHKHPNYNESSYNNMADSGATSYNRNSSNSPFSSRMETQPQAAPFSTTPWRKPLPSSTAIDTFASVLKRVDNDPREPDFGPFMQAERTRVSPWTWAGESDRSESGSGGARPSPDVFFQNSAVGITGSSGLRSHYMEDNIGTSSRAQSCDSALVSTGVGVGVGSYSNIHQDPIRRPTPTSPYAFGNSPVEPMHNNPHDCGMNMSGSPGQSPAVPEWDTSMKLGTFWSSHKTTR